MDYSANTPRQLAQVLCGQRKARGFTQKEAANLVGLLPKTISALESAPDRSRIGSLFKLMSALDLELVLRPRSTVAEPADTVEW